MLSSPSVDVTAGNKRRKKLLQQLTAQATNSGRLGGVPGAGVMSKFIARSAVPRISGQSRGAGSDLASRLGPGGYGVPGLYEQSGSPGAPASIPALSGGGISSGSPVAPWDPGQVPPTALPQPPIGQPGPEPTPGGEMPQPTPTQPLPNPGYGTEIPIDAPQPNPGNFGPEIPTDTPAPGTGWQAINPYDPSTWYMPQAPPQYPQPPYSYNPDDELFKWH